MNAAAPPRPVGHRGGPLIVLLMLIAAWAMLRVAWWDDPFARPEEALASELPAGGIAPRSLASPLLMAGVPLPEAALDPVSAGLPLPQGYGPGYGGPPPPGAVLAGPPPGYYVVAPRAVRPRRLVAYGPAPELRPDPLGTSWSLPPGRPGAAPAEPPAQVARAQDNAPFFPARAPAPEPAPAKKPSRWSLDGWAFYRQGSSALVPVSEGRVPIYGASQTGTLLQYRLSRTSRHDPRLYLRGYSAVEEGGEREVALGASLRPLGHVPVRVAAEARYTMFASGLTAVRPAAYAVTELAPMQFPLGTRLEAYAQGGWVGGPGQTFFADGQASVLRELGFVGRMSKDAVRLSLGAGAWGGAQTGAQRVDIGPTLRLDMKFGPVPTRVSVDWRQRVAGDAVPDSGVAATISTGF